MYPVYKSIGKIEKCEKVKVLFPQQHQDSQPGLEYIMEPRPISDNPYYIGSCKLQGKVAIITGGDSGIGRAVAYAFAKEGADIAISYLCEHKDANETKAHIERLGRKCILIPGDLKNEEMSKVVVEKTIKYFGKIDILVNNHGVQFIQESILDITAEQLDETFKTNIYSFFYMTKAVLPHLKKGASIINTTSITAYQGEPLLIDYSATKGAILTFTRSLSQSLISKGIRVNGVAPGPIWTPLIPSSFSAKQVETFGSYTSKVPMNRAGQPFEVATSFVFLASDDSSYMSGQILHPNGGSIVGS
ncbi:dehydrogenase [[Clostridium] sordellii]|uniref:Short chain dehydrogenase n=1 Tax=Paraclostridium sordellii TaxID=1505 RepID=A0ABM9RP80_PARSO|nr:SDR family oxidoreductase [Paeniclostridium sordellii]TAN66859.1 SDR family oxidoreductase [Paeniclostridium sordellii 8483]CEJ73841.1 short chain dehydrogenase [[Clostridium] sordellii] [Paeniclostridium sordellii]CEK29799.1 dehydrogenase [[Clostridium] sordellii] [Paeniclostridium sordellii]CEN69388.1 dehydrogenase [[Clostridium] sordellii] [Paeniclostridium sordellii]CEN72656.1 dehydrogenase [[Clostridium] sordellii] [Paeniclostridium sordellii]